MDMTEYFLNLQSEIGYPIELDAYEGKNDIYMVYNYEDEKTALYGDNRPLVDTVYMQLKLYTPKNYDYLQDKKRIRDKLIDSGFIITGIRTILEDVVDKKGQKIRCTVFTIEYFGAH